VAAGEAGCGIIERLERLGHEQILYASSCPAKAGHPVNIVVEIGRRERGVLDRPVKPRDDSFAGRGP
jgi:hypothetical protein